MLSEAPNLHDMVRRRIAREGLTEFLYAIAGRIDFPRNGFPRYGVDEFIKTASREVAAGALILDAGAGHRPYKGLFDHAEYQSCDYMPVLEETGSDTGVLHTFYCDLENIPRESGTYDAIICNQVLEHVRRPGNVIGEFFRILKPGGKLFLTAPQCFGIHMEPHNYYNFINYGLKFLFEEAGFEVISIKPLGGIFWLLGKVMQKGYGVFLVKMQKPMKTLFLPFHLLIRFFIAILSFLFFHLDKLDDEKGWTLNYGCSCVKPMRNYDCV